MSNYRLETLRDEQIIHFRDSFRNSRLVALVDAEAFDATAFALERFGKFLSQEEMNLDKYKSAICDVAESSCLAKDIPEVWADYHSSFADLYDQLRVARNSAFHDGAMARHAASHAVLVSITLEDALMSDRDRIGDFMVRMPACACMWHPLSFIRQTLLASSFSYLPVNIGTEARPDWRLVSDCSLATFLRGAKSGKARKRLLSMTLKDAVDSNAVSLIEPFLCEAGDTVQDVLPKCNHHPVLIISKDTKQLLGIATAFDLL